uniref:Uncharacterized protein n=1 Tax=Siphoviridae sp. ctTIi48 TaxID=2827875 RepID=A0A8S5TLX9_9CAUD|nr:MAG TPA: hypothetical protein [Siphoviridae sp. ctTIi48]
MTEKSLKRKKQRSFKNAKYRQRSLKNAERILHNDP